MSSSKALAVAFRMRVLNFWFANNRWSSPEHRPAKSAATDESDFKRWFRSSPELDKQVRDNFEADLARLTADDYRYPNDLDEPEHLLACIIALDQFPRNIYRQDPRAFSFDYKAKEYSEELIQHQGDRQLPYMDRAFVYLPFEHSENLDDQDKCVNYCQQLYDEAKQDATCDEKMLGLIQTLGKFALEHREVIQQFGRFPHRNAVLGRTSTEAEEAYLRDGGARFGQ